MLKERSVNILGVVLLIASGLTRVSAQDKIVGGSPMSIANRAFQMQLFYAGSFTCGGSLITGMFVVTAAHCVEGRRAAPFMVKGGATHLTDDGVRRGVQRIIISGNYNPNTVAWDVALLKLQSKMFGNNIKLVALCSGPVPDNAAVKVTGWGTTSENGGASNQLQQVQLLSVAKSECNQSYQGGITGTMMCATNPGKDSCYGDSGGPLTHNNQLCGIVSWGYGCARDGYPGVYTDINVVKTFINKAIANNS